MLYAACISTLQTQQTTELSEFDCLENSFPTKQSSGKICVYFVCTFYHHKRPSRIRNFIYDACKRAFLDISATLAVFCTITSSFHSLHTRWNHYL